MFGQDQPDNPLALGLMRYMNSGAGSPMASASPSPGPGMMPQTPPTGGMQATPLTMGMPSSGAVPGGQAPIAGGMNSAGASADSMHIIPPPPMQAPQFGFGTMNSAGMYG